MAGDMFGRMCRLAGLFVRVVVVAVAVAEVLYRPFNNVCHKADRERKGERETQTACVCGRHCPTAAAAAAGVGTSRFGIYMARP